MMMSSVVYVTTVEHIASHVITLQIPCITQIIMPRIIRTSTLSIMLNIT